MNSGLWVGLLASLSLVACASIPVPAPSSEDLTREAIRRTSALGPPDTGAVACWGHDTIPALIETVTDTRLDKPELRDATGQVIRPASYASTAHQRMIHDRQEVYIRTPCYNQLTPDTIVTLQRALKARGYYLQALTGVLDPATLLAIRHYQADHGLDTPVLSLKAAENLGLVSVDPSKL